MEVHKSLHKLEIRIRNSVRCRFLTALFILLVVDWTVASWVFSTINTGYLVFGDLSGFYDFSPISQLWLSSLSLYAFTEQFLAIIFGQNLAHNGIFLASLFAPSVGIYLFLASLTKKVTQSALIAFVTGTPVNPVLGSVFIGGGWEYGPWVFLVFISLWLLVLAKNSTSRQSLVVLSSLALGLSATESLWFVGLSGGGLLLSFPVVLSYFVATILAPTSTNWKRATLTLTFIIPLLLTVGSIVEVAFWTAANVVPNGSHISTINGYVAASISYTFRPYSMFNSLFNGAPVGTQGGFIAVITPFWEFIITIALCGLCFGLLQGKRQMWKATAIFGGFYLLATGFLFGNHIGVLYWLYVDFRPIDYLDAPIFFCLLQLICLPYLLFTGFEFLYSVLQYLPSGMPLRIHGRRYTELFGSLDGENSLTGPTVMLPSKGDARRVHAAILIPAMRIRKSQLHKPFILCIVLVLLLTIQFNTRSLPVEAEAGLPLIGMSSLSVPSSYAEVHQWYAGLSTSDLGMILPVPDTFTTYRGLIGFIPANRLWQIPFLGSAVLPNVNVSIYSSVIDQIELGDVTGFSALAGESGVEYVLVLNGTSGSSLAFAVNGGNSNETTSQVFKSLSNSGAFNMGVSNNGFTVFQNKYYHGYSHQYTRGIAFDSTLPSVNGSQSYMVASWRNFTTWTSYLGSSVQQETNGSIEVTVNPRSPVPYVFEWTNLPSIIAQGAHLECCNTSAVTFNASTSETTYLISGHLKPDPGVEIDVSIYWYNTTSPPQFYSQFASTNLGAYNDLYPAFRANFTSPAGALLGRLIYHIWEPNGTAIGRGLIWPPLINANVIPVKASQSTQVQLDFLNSMTEDALISPNTFVLPYPFSNQLEPPVEQGFGYVQLVTASMLAFDGGQNLSTKRETFEWPGFLNGPSFFLLTGIDNGSQSGKLEVGQTGQSDTSIQIPPGPFFVKIGLQRTGHYPSINVLAQGEFVLGYAALYTLPGNFTVLAAGTIGVGIGVASIVSNASNVSVHLDTRILIVDVLGRNPINFVPLAGATLSVLFATLTSAPMRSRIRAVIRITKSS